MKSFTKIASIILAFVALLHLARIILNTQVMIDNLMIPMWVSIVGFIVPSIVSIGLWRESKWHYTNLTLYHLKKNRPLSGRKACFWQLYYKDWKTKLLCHWQVLCWGCLWWVHNTITEVRSFKHGHCLEYYATSGKETNICYFYFVFKNLWKFIIYETPQWL